MQSKLCELQAKHKQTQFATARQVCSCNQVHHGSPSVAEIAKQKC